MDNPKTPTGPKTGIPKTASAAPPKLPAAPKGMAAIKPSLGKTANLLSPLPKAPPKVMSTPQADMPSKEVVDPKWRSGSLETLHERIPRRRPRYKLQVPMDEAFRVASEGIAKDIESVKHPGDKERYQEDLDELNAAFKSGNPGLLIKVLENTIDAKTFNHLIQSLHDHEPPVTSNPGLFAKGDPLRFIKDAEQQRSHSKKSPWPVFLAKAVADIAGAKESPPKVWENIKLGFYDDVLPSALASLKDFGTIDVVEFQKILPKLQTLDTMVSEL